MIHNCSNRPFPPPPTRSVSKVQGEAGATGSMPALMNAVVDALRGAGVAHFDMPGNLRALVASPAKQSGSELN